MPLPWLIVAGGSARRVAGFQAALAATGLPPADVISFDDFLDDKGVLARVSDEPRLVRLDLAELSWRAERRLLARGFAEAVALGVPAVDPATLAEPPARGRIFHPRQQHLGFARALADLGRLCASKRRWTLLNDVDDVQTLFDKRVTSRRYQALAIPVPPPLDVGGVSGEALVAAMDARDLDAAYVKLSCGSSAECMAFVKVGRRGPELLTTIEVARDGWFNTRKPAWIRDPRRFDAIVAWLLREGSQVEAAVDKARVGAASFDVRAVVVAGRVVVHVMRASRLPFTNLQLHATRGDVAAIDAAVGGAARAAGDEVCRRVFAAHRSLHVGVDVAFARGTHAPVVLEANAFGDFLVREGLDVYRAEVAAARAAHE